MKKVMSLVKSIYSAVIEARQAQAEFALRNRYKLWD